MTSPAVRGAVLLEPRRIEFHELSLPALNAEDVELEPLYVGICGTDITCYQGKNALLNTPVVLGHEFCARVRACGSQVKTVSPGQIVAVAPLIACGGCRFCAAGQEHLCPERVIFGVRSDGALRERLVMPSRALFPVPDGVNWRDCALTEPLAVAVHAVRRTRVAGRRVTISGAGAIGLLIAQVVQVSGAASVLLLDVEQQRLDLARRMGFEAGLPDQAVPHGAECLFIATDATTAMAALPGLIDFGGDAVIVGLLDETPINWLNLLLKEGTITTSRYFTLNDFQAALNMLVRAEVDVSWLIQDQVEFERVADQQGETLVNRARQVIRLVVNMPAAHLDVV
jgi:2-desacetyl-2-hydroxyethyl bacteriochlorophyllide A dehydrogenase